MTLSLKGSFIKSSIAYMTKVGILFDFNWGEKKQQTFSLSLLFPTHVWLGTKTKINDSSMHNLKNKLLQFCEPHPLTIFDKVVN